MWGKIKKKKRATFSAWAQFDKGVNGLENSETLGKKKEAGQPLGEKNAIRNRKQKKRN